MNEGGRDREGGGEREDEHVRALSNKRYDHKQV